MTENDIVIPDVSTTPQRIAMLLMAMSQAAVEQEIFHTGRDLSELMRDLEWAQRMAATQTAGGAHRRRARTRSVLAEALRCALHVREVANAAGDESWPPLTDAGDAVLAELRGVLLRAPELLGPPEEIERETWTDTEDGAWFVRADGLWVSIRLTGEGAAAKVAGVTVGFASDENTARQMAVTRAAELFP